MNKRGRQTRAGKLLSSFIRTIAEEKTESISDPDAGGKIVTKAEALARLIWKRALGWTEFRVEGDGAKDIVHPPDKYLMALLFDRMEGRAPAAVDEGDEKLSVSERVSEQGKKRINDVVDGS